MAVTGKALSAVTTTYATLQAGDIMAWERAGVVGKTTWAEVQTQDMTLTGTIDMSGATVTWDGGPLDFLAGTSITGLSGADLTLLTGTAGADGNLTRWNADGDVVDGPDVQTTITDTDGAVPTSGAVVDYYAPSGADTGHSLNTEYQNTSGRPQIHVVQCLQTGAASSLRVECGAASASGNFVARQYAAASAWATVTFVVPPGYYYAVDDAASGTGGAWSIVSWERY